MQTLKTDNKMVGFLIDMVSRAINSVGTSARAKYRRFERTRQAMWPRQNRMVSMVCSECGAPERGCYHVRDLDYAVVTDVEYERYRRRLNLIIAAWYVFLIVMVCVLYKRG